MTIRHGNQNDPAWANSMPVTIAALKRRAGRILHLASGLQIALRVQVTAKGPSTYFVEPGSECVEFATRRLGGRDAALLKKAIRRSPITEAAVQTAVKQAEERWQDEIKSLQGRMATLERAAKKHAELAATLKKRETALREARVNLRASDATAKKKALDSDEEVQTLKSRIVVVPVANHIRPY